MELEESLPLSQQPATGPDDEPHNSIPMKWFVKKYICLRWAVVSLPQNPQTTVHPL
jgi:hypothetical protein